jgi:Family of unknown function (DUF6221)
VSSEKAVEWLREQIGARKAAAGAARHGTDGHWWRRTHAPYVDSAGREPCGDLWSGEPERDEDGEITLGENIVVYDEGAPSDAEFTHIALNDPQDTIARCEAELAILDAYAEPSENAYSPEYYTGLWVAVCATARAYRHREGYAEHWGSAG